MKHNMIQLSLQQPSWKISGLEWLEKLSVTTLNRKQTNDGKHNNSTFQFMLVPGSSEVSYTQTSQSCTYFHDLKLHLFVCLHRRSPSWRWLTGRTTSIWKSCEKRPNWRRIKERMWRSWWRRTAYTRLTRSFTELKALSTVFGMEEKTESVCVFLINTCLGGFNFLHQCYRCNNVLVC